MATPRKTVSAVQAAEDYFENEPTRMPASIPQAEEDVGAEIALSTTLQQLGEDQAETAKIIIHRVVEDKGRMVEEYLYETTPAEFAVEGVGGIAREHGGGTYKVRVFLKGRQGFLTQKVIKIAREVKPITVPQAAPNAGIAELAAVMSQGFQQLGALIAQSSQAPKTDSRADFLREMMLMKELFSSGQSAAPSPAAGMSDMMEIFKQGMEIGRMGGGEPTTADVLMKGLEAFAPALQTVVAQASQAAPMQQARALPMPSQAPQVQPAPQEAQSVNVKQAMLKQYLGFLVMQARQNSDPYTYANLILDNLSEQEVNELLTSPNWLDQLATLEPEVKAPDVAPWMQEVKAAIAELLSDPSPAADLTAPVNSGTNQNHAIDQSTENPAPQGDIGPNP